MEFVVLDFDSTPSPPSDSPPNPESAPDTMDSSVAEVISTDIVGVERGGARGGEGALVPCDCNCWPKPKDVLPKADGAPENALNPNALPELAASVASWREAGPKALAPFAVGDVSKAL